MLRKIIIALTTIFVCALVPTIYVVILGKSDLNVLEVLEAQFVFFLYGVLFILMVVSAVSFIYAFINMFLISDERLKDKEFQTFESRWFSVGNVLFYPENFTDRGKMYRKRFIGSLVVFFVLTSIVICLGEYLGDYV